MAGETGGSSEYVTKNTKALREDGIDVRMRSTIHRSNIGKQKELVDYAASLGVETIVAEPAIRSPSLSETGSIYLVDLDEFVLFQQLHLGCDRKCIGYQPPKRTGSFERRNHHHANVGTSNSDPLAFDPRRTNLF